MSRWHVEAINDLTSLGRLRLLSLNGSTRITVKCWVGLRGRKTRT